MFRFSTSIGTFISLFVILTGCQSPARHGGAFSDLQGIGDGRCERIAPWNPQGVTGHRTWYAGNLWTQVIDNRVSGRTGRHPLLSESDSKQAALINQRQIVAINAADVHKGVYDRMLSICLQVVAAGGSVDEIDQRIYDTVRGGGDLANGIRTIIGAEIIGQTLKFRFATLDGTRTSDVYEFVVMDVFTMQGMAFDMGMISPNNKLGVREANQFIADFDRQWLQANVDQMFATTLLLDGQADAAVVNPAAIGSDEPAADRSNLKDTDVPGICSRFKDFAAINTCEKSLRQGDKQSRRLLDCTEGKLKLCPGACQPSNKKGEHDVCVDAAGQRVEPLAIQ